MKVNDGPKLEAIQTRNEKKFEASQVRFEALKKEKERK